MLADVAQKLDRRQLPCPGQVVLDDGTGGRVVELHEALQLTADPACPVRDGVGGLHGAFTTVSGIADHAGRATGQHDGPMSGLLEPAQRQQRDQVPSVQARRGRIETGIDRDRPSGQLVGKGVTLGGLRDETAPVQLIEDGGHASIFPHSSRVSR